MGSGFGCLVSGFGLRVECLAFPVFGFWFRVSGFCVCLGFRFLVSGSIGFRFLVPGECLGYRFLFPGSWFLVSGF